MSCGGCNNHPYYPPPWPPQPSYPQMQGVDPMKVWETANKIAARQERKRLQKEEEAKKKEKEKKPEVKTIQPMQLAAVIFLMYPILGPLYNYMIIAMNKQAIEAMQVLFK